MYNNDIIYEYVDFRTKNPFEILDDDYLDKSVKNINKKIKKIPNKYSLVYDRYTSSKAYSNVKLKINKIIESKIIDKKINNQYVNYKYQDDDYDDSDYEYQYPEEYKDDDFDKDYDYNDYSRYDDDYDDFDKNYDSEEIQDYYDTLGCDHKDMDPLLYSYGYYDNHDCIHDCNCYHCTRYCRLNIK